MFNSDISHQFGHMFTVTLYFKTKKNSSFISVWNHIFFPCTAGEMLKKKHKHASLFSSVRLTGASAAWETSSTGTSSPPSSWGTPPGLSSNWPWVPRCTKATWCVQYHFVCWSLLYAPRSALGNLCFKLKEKSGGDWWKDRHWMCPTNMLPVMPYSSVPQSCKTILYKIRATDCCCFTSYIFAYFIY